MHLLSVTVITHQQSPHPAIHSWGQWHFKHTGTELSTHTVGNSLRFKKKNKRQSLSQASIESLAIVAYKQPITRVDIDEIRGVKSESALQRLLERDLIKDVGRLEVPGRPILYGTTDEFLRQFGLQSLNELPSLDLYEDSDENNSLELLSSALEEIEE